MNFKEKALKINSNLHCRISDRRSDVFLVFDRNWTGYSEDPKLVGFGSTQEEAWKDAYHELVQEDYRCD
jgi:hypothetical protein